MKNNTSRFVKNIASTVLCNRTICRRVEKFWTKGSPLGKEKIWKHYVSSEGKLLDISTWIEARPQKHLSLVWFLRVDVLKASDHTVKKLLKLWPYEAKAIQELFAPDWDSRSQWYRYFQEMVANGFHGFELVSLFFRCGIVYLKYVLVSWKFPYGIWSSFLWSWTVIKIIGSMFYDEKIYFALCIPLILLPFFVELTEE